MNIKLIPVFFLLFLASVITACGDPDSGFATIYLVRHAEKDLSDTSDNPPLTPEGILRAEKLVGVIGETEIDGIYSTAFDRNMNTVRPLAAKKNITIQQYEWQKWHDMIDEIKMSPGKTFVICGHGDNMIPMIHYMNGRPPLDSLAKYEYDKIFKIELRPDTATVSVITY